MRKQTLASLATLLLTATTASADPWAGYDWSSNSFAPQANAAMSSYRAPAYPRVQQPASFQTPVVTPQQAVQPVAEESTEIEQTSHCNSCQSERYAAPVQSYATPAPAAAPVQGYCDPAQNYPVNPYYVGGGYDTGYAACAPVPTSNYSVSLFAEAILWNREDSFNGGRNFVEGPNDSGFGFNQTAGNDQAGGWRIGGDILFGDACSDWQHGFGFTYADLGAYQTSQSGQFDLGIAFDAGTKGTDPSTLAGCYILTDNTFFASLVRASSINTLTVNEQDEFEGLGPDPSTFPADPTRQTGSENFQLPTWRVDYSSEINQVGAHFLLARKNKRRFRFGVGWQQLNVDERSFAAITGPLHATDARFFNPGVGDPNPGGLPTFPTPNADRNFGLSAEALTDSSQNNGADPDFEFISQVGGGGVSGIGSGLSAAPAGGTGVGANGVDGLVELLSSQQATNTLNGINFFASAQLFCKGRFDINGRANMGVYHNSANAAVVERVRELGFDQSTYARGYTDTADVVSFVGGAGLDMGYWFTDCCRLYGGYEVLFINGVALSPDQESGLNGSTFHLKHDGDLILHGARVGLEFLY